MADGGAPPAAGEFAPGETFLLHVFWEAPSVAAAHELLAGLRKCAAASARDAPGAVTYFFRIADMDGDLCAPPRRTVADHTQLMEGKRKILVGVPPPAVRAQLARMGVDPSLVDADPATELPAALQTQSVMLEFTEVYLDEKSFMDHARARDFLDGYAVTTKEELQLKRPITVRLGTPTARIVDTILEGFLHEVVLPVEDGCAVWKGAASVDTPVFLSLDVTGSAAADVAAALPAGVRDQCSTCVAFPHPLRDGTVRIMCVVPARPSAAFFEGLASLSIARGEAHVTVGGEAAVAELRGALAAAGLGTVTVNANRAEGFVLHEAAPSLRPRP